MAGDGSRTTARCRAASAPRRAERACGAGRLAHESCGRQEAVHAAMRAGPAFRQFQYPTSPEHADLTLKEKALNSLPQTGAPVGRYRPPDAVLAFLDNL